MYLLGVLTDVFTAKLTSPCLGGFCQERLALSACLPWQFYMAIPAVIQNILTSVDVQATGGSARSADTMSPDNGHIVSPQQQSPSLRRTTGSTGSVESGASVKHASNGPRTLMYFKGCPRPLGCSVLLHGADSEQLHLLKKVTKVCMLWQAFLSKCGHRS